MNISLYVQQFTDKYIEMLNALHKILPDNKSINLALAKKLDKLYMMDIIETYINTMHSFNVKLTKNDESIFLKRKVVFFKDFNLSKIWNKKLKKNHKETMWQYLHVLYLTGTCSNDIKDQNPINFLKNNIDDKKINDMEEELKNLDEDKLQETCSSISSMIGDNDGIINNIFKDIQQELKNPTPSDNKDHKDNKQAQMFQQLFGLQGSGMSNLFNVFENVSKKMGDKVESGELDINKLQQTAQKMMQNLTLNNSD